VRSGVEKTERDYNRSNNRIKSALGENPQVVEGKSLIEKMIKKKRSNQTIPHWK